MTIPIYYQIAGAYFLVSVIGGTAYAWFRYHRRHRTPPVIHREHGQAGRQKLTVYWRDRTYTSWDGYEWITTKGKPVSRHLSRKFQNFVLTYGWMDV